MVFELKTCYYVLIAFLGEHRCHFWLFSKLKVATIKVALGNIPVSYVKVLRWCFIDQHVGVTLTA